MTQDQDGEATAGRDAAADDEEEDPIVEECVRDALTPYVRILSPEGLAEHRSFLIVFIMTHPATAPLHERLRKRPAVLAESGEVAREGTIAADPEQARGDGTVGGSQ